MRARNSTYFARQALHPIARFVAEVEKKLMSRAATPHRGLGSYLRRAIPGAQSQRYDDPTVWILSSGARWSGCRPPCVEPFGRDFVVTFTGRISRSGS